MTPNPMRAADSALRDHLAGGLLVGAYRVDDLPMDFDGESDAAAAVVRAVRAVAARAGVWPVNVAEVADELIVMAERDPFETLDQLRYLMTAWSEREERARRAATLLAATRLWARDVDALEAHASRLVTLADRVRRLRERARRSGALLDTALRAWVRDGEPEQARVEAA